MKRLQNTLYVTTQKSYLAREGETVVVRSENEVLLRAPIHTLGGIVCFGNVTCSPWLMELCSERDVAISFLTEHGRFLARVQGAISGNVLLRRAQYRCSDDEKASSLIARSVILAKVVNCRTVLQRALRDHPELPSVSKIQETLEYLEALRSAIQEAESLEKIRGIEGDAARAYFSVFDHLVTTQKEDFFLHERTRRPPLDNLNSLLSFLYTLLAHDCSGALEAVGLDPQVGFLHRERPGRPSLALDLMEEFRPFLADRLAISLVNLRQVQGSGFRREESGAVLMDEPTRKEVLGGYQKRKQDSIVHPFLNEKTTVGLLVHFQALLMARFLRGDLDAYPSFIWK